MSSFRDQRPRGGSGGRSRRGGFRGDRRSRDSQSHHSNSRNGGGFWGWLKALFGSHSSASNGSGSRRDSGQRRPYREGGSGQRSGGSGEGRTPRNSEPTPITTPRLHVGNLSYETSESDLFDHFSKVGAVKNVQVVMDKQRNRSKGFGFVEMETLETAEEAARQYNDTDFMGRKIFVNGALAEERNRF